MSELIFGFDLGTGSIGLAVRKGDKILHAESLLIDQDVASIKEQRDRRRQFRTRQSHKNREKELEKLWKKAGLTPLYGRRHKPKENEKGFEVIKGDKRLEREFSAKGDETIYTSCLLRIKLLQGEQLEEWQVFKALRSAVQRRGYDTKVPWATQDKDRKHYEKAIGVYEQKLKDITSNTDYHFPCYYDAYQMNLWNSNNGIVAIRIDEDKNNRAKRARSNALVASRQLVESEVKRLWHNAQAQIPALKDIDVMQALYGEEGEAYKHATKQQGILDQKIPRFDNRMLNKCCLLPRFNTCRADEILVLEATFLMKLYNLNYLQGTEKRKLSADELKEELNKKKQELKKYLNETWNKLKKKQQKKEKQKFINKKTKIFKITNSQWKKYLDKKNRTPYLPDDEVAKPKASGRSRFSRPALKILIDLILSGLSPQEFKNKKGQELKTKYKLKEDELNFLDRMGEDWENGIFIPAIPLSEQKEKSNHSSYLQLVLKNCTDPIVRHRLALFEKEFDKLVNEFGKPDKVRLEFIREDFMGEETLKKFNQNQNKNEKANEQARQKLLEQKQYSKTNLTKYKLLTEQANKCLFTGEALCLTKLQDYEIEHLLPKTQGGSNAFYNLVLTTKKSNQEKGNKTPYQWLRESGKWECYKNRVSESVKSKEGIGKKKALMLLSKNALEIDENAQNIQETAWIAKLARNLVALKVGYDLGQEGDAKKVQVINGSQTAGLRRKYNLNSLLNLEKFDIEKELIGKPREKCLASINKVFKEFEESVQAEFCRIFYKPNTSEEEIQEELKNFKVDGHRVTELALDKKNRADKRHHALDAIVICYLEEWGRDVNKRDRFRLPKNIDRNYIKSELDKVVPKKIGFSKAGLLEQASGYNEEHFNEKEEKKVFQTKDLDSLFKNNQGKYQLKDTDIKTKISNIVDSNIKNLLEKKLIQDISESQSDFIEKRIAVVENFILTNQTKVRKVKVYGAKLNYFKNLSKDKNVFEGQYYGNKRVTGEGEKNHGYYVTRKDDKIEIHKINSFDSRYLMKQNLLREGYEVITGKRIFAGCLIELENDFIRKKGNIRKGIYTLKSLKSNGTTFLESCGKVEDSFSFSGLLKQTNIKRH